MKFWIRNVHVLLIRRYIVSRPENIAIIFLVAYLPVEQTPQLTLLQEKVANEPWIECLGLSQHQLWLEKLALGFELVVIVLLELQNRLK